MSEAKSTEILIGQSLLGISGGAGLPVLYKSYFASYAYEISLVSGIVGFFACVTDHETLKKIHYYLDGMCQCFVVPLIASQVCCVHGLKLEVAALQLIYPTIFYFGKYIAENDDVANKSVLEVSHALSVCAIAYFSCLDRNWWGVGLSFIYATYCFGNEIFEEARSSVIALAIGNFIYYTQVY